MITNQFSKVAQKISEQYVNALESFTGTFHTILNTGNAISLRSQPVTLYRASTRFLDDALAEVRTQTQKVAQEAYLAATKDIGSEAPMDTFLDEFITQMVEQFETMLRGIVDRDTNAVITTLRKVAIQSDILRRSRNLTENQARIAAREAYKGALKFGFMDRVGRSWKSETYVRTIVRHHLVITYIESYMLTALDHGIDQFKVVNADPNHRFDGLEFSFGESVRGLPTYFEIKDEVFHPNTNSTAEIIK